jgi:glyoxylase-like metal-dependent hydrolase (beta-lactamase superfamily II)
MRIHALPIGYVVLKQSFLHPRAGLRRRLDLVLPGPWSEPMPIRAWLVEHGDERILVDMGETADVKDAPFARHTVTPEDELPLALRAVGLACEDVTTAVVTHLHPDHFHGAVHLTTSVLVNEAEWADAMSFRGRVFQRLTGVPLPGGIDFRPVALDDGPFGALAACRRRVASRRVASTTVA